jgi:acid stress-induced BolA-like protein IbaG/YrbA
MKKDYEIQKDLDNITSTLGLSGVHTMAEPSGKWLHLLIACNEFENMTQTQRENIVWKEFEKHFDDSTILSITQCYLLSAAEYEEFQLQPQ